MIENVINSDEQDLSITISKDELADLRGQLAALHEFQCIAEYTMDGKVITANENYLKLIGYAYEELIGRDIGMLLDLKYNHSTDNILFWERLNSGDCISGKFKRIAKGAKTVWIQATYFPMMDSSGKPFKVVEYAIDITEHMQLEQALARTVQQVQEVVLAVKSNDLTQRIPLEGKPAQIANLSNDVNSLIECMKIIVTLINKTGDSIMVAVNKVNAANKALSQCKKNHVA